MKPWLVLDSSGERALVGVVCAESGRTLGQCSTGEPRKHAEKLAELIDLALEKANVNFRELQGIFAGRGPGSFVGVRVAMSHAKGLAHALKIPVVGHCSLLAHVSLELQQELIERSPEGRGIVMTDARRNEIFARNFELRDQKIRALGEPETLSFAQARVLAEGAALVVSSIASERPAHDVLEHAKVLQVPGPSADGALAQQDVSALAEDVRGTLVPHYGRAPDATAPVLVKMPSAAAESSGADRG